MLYKLFAGTLEIRSHSESSRTRTFRYVGPFCRASLRCVPNALQAQVGPVSPSSPTCASAGKVATLHLAAKDDKDDKNKRSA